MPFREILPPTWLANRGCVWRAILAAQARITRRPEFEPVKLPINGHVAEVHCGRAIKEASARHGPSPTADGVFTDRLINSPG